MRIYGETLIFKTGNDHYEEEKRGIKPYTVRILSHDERQMLGAVCITKIRIEHTIMDGVVFFERLIRSITSLGEIFGQCLVGIAWIHEEDKELPKQ
jgi:hypothetical protein